jgi:hypothetical protein
MSTDWQTPYFEALRETDPAKVSKACEHARLMIEQRVAELARARAPHYPEKENLDEALRQLWIHEQKFERSG